MPYLTYPAVDENKSFPPSVRAAIANSPEMTSKFAQTLGKTVFTTTISGITSGFVQSVAYYSITGGLASFTISLNTNAAIVGSDLTLTLPIDIDAPAWFSLGSAVLNPGGTRYDGRIIRAGTAHHIWVKFPTPATGVLSALSSSVPAAWTNGQSQSVAVQFTAPVL